MKLTPAQTIEYCINVLRIRRVPYIAGMPGIGKSDVAKKIAKNLGLKIVDVRLTQKEPEDLTGLPQLVESRGRAQYVPFDSFPLEGDDMPLREDGTPYKGWLLFFDELSSCEDDVLAACYNILLDRKVGMHSLHKNTFVMAAGNLSTHSAIARQFPDTIKTRILAVEMEANLNDWVDWANEPSTVSDPDVIEYLQGNRNMFHGTGPEDSKYELESYAQPRGWAVVMELLQLQKRLNKKNKSKETKAMSSLLADVSLQRPKELDLTDVTKWGIQAAVGPLAAKGFVDYYRVSKQLPLVSEIVKAPNSTHIPKNRISQQHMVENLATYFVANEIVDVRGAVLQYVNRMESEFHNVFYNLLVNGMPRTSTNAETLSQIKIRLGVVELTDLD